MDDASILSYFIMPKADCSLDDFSGEVDETSLVLQVALAVAFINGHGYAFNDLKVDPACL